MSRDDDILTQLDVPLARSLPPEQVTALKNDLFQRIGASAPPGLRRSSQVRFLRVRGRLVVPVLAAVIAGAFAGSLTTAYALAGPDAPRASPESLTAISTEGTPVRLTRRSQALPGSAQAFLMATRGSTAYLRVPLKDGLACFYTGRVDDQAAYELGTGRCWTPAPRFPILDLSPIQAGGAGGFQVLQIQGFAADGVTTIAVKDMNGRTIAETAVRNNAYRMTAYPQGGVSALVALDDGGHVLQRINYTVDSP